MRIVLREILRRVELAATAEPGEKTRLKHVIMTPARGGRITVRAVKQVASAAADTPEVPSARL